MGYKQIFSPKYFSLESRSQDAIGRRYFRAEHLRFKSLVLNFEYLRILINSVLHVFVFVFELSVSLSLSALGFTLWIMASCFMLALFKRPAVGYEWVRLMQPSWTRSLWEEFHISSISVQSCGEDQTLSQPAIFPAPAHKWAFHWMCVSVTLNRTFMLSSHCRMVFN